MELPALNIVDFVLIAIMALSITRGFSRGGIREIAGVAGWVAAFIIAFIFAPEVRPLMPEIGVFGDYADTCLISGFLAFFALFLLTMIAVALVTPAVERGTAGAFGSGDRVFGLLFGIVRGVAIIIGGYLLYDVFVPLSDQSDFLTSAGSYDMLKSISSALRDSTAGSIPGWLGGRIEALVDGCSGYLPAVPGVSQ